MTISKTLGYDRYKGTCYEINFEERPECTYCGKPMRIITHGKPAMRIGLYENYETTIAYYRCGRSQCPGTRKPLIRASNPYCADDDEYDYEVKAKVCEFRWNYHFTYDEIRNEIMLNYGIDINHSGIEIILKMYEMGCEKYYRLEYISKIQEKGGVLLQVDAMKPLKGKSALYTAKDYYSGLKLSSKHLHREGQAEIEHFLGTLKNILDKENIPVLGVISDASRGQLKAIEAVFGPDIPHSLCHFHFFSLILKKSKELDSSIITELRQYLRNIYYVQEYRKRHGNKHMKTEDMPFIEHILHDLYVLSNWCSRKKDPTFSSIVYYQRIYEIKSVLADCISDFDKRLVSLELKIEKRIRKLYMKLTKVLNSVEEGIEELKKIKEHLTKLSEILENDNETALEGLENLRKLSKSLIIRKKDKNCGRIERDFVIQLKKFINTKGSKLFAYRLISGAPRTNNGLELDFKQIKHLLRRTIGYNAAGTYLLAHGERILFVNPKESFQKIIQILKLINLTDYRKQIKQERVPRNSIIYIIHDPIRWIKEINILKEKWLILKDQILIRR